MSSVARWPVHAPTHTVDPSGIPTRKAPASSSSRREVGGRPDGGTGRTSRSSIERFWGVLQSELLDRELFPTPEAANEGLMRFAVYYDYHRLNGAIGWQTPAERWDGTPFTDEGFEYVPALEQVQGWLTELMPMSH